MPSRSTLLHHIFSDVTKDRELLDTSPIPLLGHIDFSLLTMDQTRYRANIQMKMSLLFVCKWWYSTAIGFLYHIVRITRHTQFVSLLKAIESTQIPFGDPSRHAGLGRHIKCLLLELNEWYSPYIYIDGISTLLGECPVLRVFCLDVDAYEHPDALLEIGGQTATSLRSCRVVCRSSMAGSAPFTLPLLQAIGSFENLEKLELDILDVTPVLMKAQSLYTNSIRCMLLSGACLRLTTYWLD
jgi:hypothetical protein